MLDYAARRIKGDITGVDNFWNLALAAPTTGITPPYIWGGMYAGVNDYFTYSLLVHGADGADNSFDVADAYKNGTTVFASVKFPLELFGLSGWHGFKGGYSTKNGHDSRDWLDPGDDEHWEPREKGRRFFYSYFLHHYLVRYSDSPTDGWGFFGRIGASDSNPSNTKFTMLAGLGGRGWHRHQDAWGVALYYYKWDKHKEEFFKSDLVPFGPIGDELGAEAFYKFAVTERVHITADVQYVDTLLKETGNVWVYGLRAAWRFW